MDTIGTWLDLISKNKVDRSAFEKEHKSPFLVTVEVMDDVLSGGGAEGTSAQTVAQDPQKMRRASIAAREANVWVIEKRVGANQAKEICIGRSRDNDVWINDAEVSKHHAHIVPAKGEFAIVDTGSTNGTFINDKRIENKKPVIVKTYDSVRLGRAAKMQFLDPGSFFDYLTVLRRFVGL